MESNAKNNEQERDERVHSEKLILEDLKNDARKIEDAINLEKSERQEAQSDLMQQLADELTRQKNKIERIKKDTDSEFKKDRTFADKEMDNRFDHQDKVIGNISFFITTFQKTLKAVGGREEVAA